MSEPVRRTATVEGGMGLPAEERVVDATEGFEELVRRARALDREAFGELYRRSVTPVYRYCAARANSTVEAEELTQEVFLAALAGIERVRADHEAAWMAWLFQIARNKQADRLRARYRRPTAPLEAAGDVEAAGRGPVEAAELEADRAAVRAALEELTPDQREVVICKYVLGYDNTRTGEVVGKNANAVNQLHHRALASLRRALTAGEVMP
ncbi:MAG: sigma-70 family RNA polymerase sigma factor [Dehalococcoidia bacterium]